MKTVYEVHWDNGGNEMVDTFTDPWLKGYFLDWLRAMKKDYIVTTNYILKKGK